MKRSGREGELIARAVVARAIFAAIRKDYATPKGFIGRAERQARKEAEAARGRGKAEAKRRERTASLISACAPRRKRTGPRSRLRGPVPLCIGGVA
jgi:hypothetical protein